MINDSSAGSIRRAVAAAQRGRIEEACAIGEDGLRRGDDPGALNAMLGLFRIKLGHDERAVQHLEIAHRSSPEDVRIATNFASALTRTGALERALEVASSWLAYADPSLQLARIRGYAADQLGDFIEASQAYEHVVSLAPRDWESWNNLGNARLGAGDLEGAIAALEKSVELAPAVAPARLNLARAWLRRGNVLVAEQQLRRMIKDFPDDIHPLLSLHDLLKAQLRQDEVGDVLERAIAVQPENVQLRVAQANNLGALLRLDAAERAFREVLELEPTNEEAFVGLAVIYEHNDPSRLETLVREAERQLAPGNGLNLVRAFAHRRAKRYAEAIEALRSVDPSFETARREHLLGQMLEAIGDVDEAFAAFKRMNISHREDLSQPMLRAAYLRAQLRAERERTTAEWVSSWKAPNVARSGPQPIFLVGFPRSGTTLLDTLLMGHPDVTVLEERPVIARLKAEVGGFDAIAKMAARDVCAARTRYFEIAAEYGAVKPGGWLIDKSPLLLAEAPFIYRLFPQAQYILALRHPADVLLSCFVSNFALNDAMANFITLDTAADLYDLTFRSWENARALLPLHVHVVRYEELVADVPAVLRRLLDNLGLSWRDEMLDHRQTAATRGLIATASYAQVSEPIYQRSVDRWRKFRRHLLPALAVVQPWAARYGYEL